MGKMVRYKMDDVPEPSKKDWDRVKAIKDKDIDFSDIPEITDFSEFHTYSKREFYKPAKKNNMQVQLAKDSKKPKWKQ